jgi:hypothetical protein
MKLAIRLVLLGLGVFATTSAQAGFTARFDSFSGDGAGAGIYMWKQGGSYGTYVPGYVESGPPSGSIHSFQSFCIQTSQHISTGNNYTYSVIELKDAPIPGSGMGPTRADNIKRMWATYKSTLGTDLKKNEAFQYAVWNLSGQSFTLSGDATVQSYYYTYLSGWGTAKANLAALADGTAQDQVFELEDGYVPSGGNIVEVPVPPAVVLVAAGIASGLFLRRRIAGQQAAVVA